MKGAYPRLLGVPIGKIIAHPCSYVKWLPRWEPMSRCFGDKLRYLRLQRGLTQTMLAQQVQSSPSHINNLESGRKVPSLELVLRVAALLGVTTDYLLRDTISTESSVISEVQAQHGETQVMRLFGAKLRHLRLKHGSSQRELARLLSLGSRAYVSNLEAGRKEPSLDLLLRLADFFGVTTDYLLRDDISVSADETPEE